MKKRWYYGKNYGTIPKTKALWFTKEEDYETLIHNEKKTHGNIPKQLQFLNKYIAFELWFTRKNYDIMETSMVLSKTNTVLWKKYDTISKTIEFWFTMEHNLGTMGKNLFYYSEL